MGKNVEFFFDVVSPYSYLASTQLEGIAQRTGAVFTWRPFFLGGVFKATGNRPPAELPARAAYMARDLDRWASHYGVPIGIPSRFPTLTLKAQRMLLAAPEAERPALARNLFAAYWTEDRNIGDDAVLLDCAARAGCSAELLQEAATPPIKEGLMAASEGAVARGAFGAPTFFVDDEMFFGNDRLALLERHLMGDAS